MKGTVGSLLEKLKESEAKEQASNNFIYFFLEKKKSSLKLKKPHDNKSKGESTIIEINR